MSLSMTIREDATSQPIVGRNRRPHPQALRKPFSVFVRPIWSRDPLSGRAVVFECHHRKSRHDICFRDLRGRYRQLDVVHAHSLRQDVRSRGCVRHEHIVARRRDHKEAAESSAGSADSPLDYCDRHEWYGDGECDTFCELPDPDRATRARVRSSQNAT